MGDEFTFITLIGETIIAGAITAIVLVIVSFIFSSIGLYAMAKKRRQARKVFWAWIPYLRLCLMGLLARDAGIKMGAKSFRRMNILLPIAGVAKDALMLVSININSVALFFLSVLAFSVLYLLCLYGLLKGYDTKNRAGRYILLSIFIPLYSSMIVFALRNKPFFLAGRNESDQG